MENRIREQLDDELDEYMAKRNLQVRLQNGAHVPEMGERRVDLPERMREALHHQSPDVIFSNNMLSQLARRPPPPKQEVSPKQEELYAGCVDMCATYVMLDMVRNRDEWVQVENLPQSIRALSAFYLMDWGNEPRLIDEATSVRLELCDRTAFVKFVSHAKAVNFRCAFNRKSVNGCILLISPLIEEDIPELTIE